jgi:hypothetical protein
MDRRRFVALVATAPIAASLALVPQRRYGHLTVARAQALGILPAHVWCDGREISNDALELDDVEGWALVYSKTEHGGKYRGADGKLAKHRIFGRIELRPMKRKA